MKSYTITAWANSVTSKHKKTGHGITIKHENRFFCFLYTQGRWIAGFRPENAPKEFNHDLAEQLYNYLTLDDYYGTKFSVNRETGELTDISVY